MRPVTRWIAIGVAWSSFALLTPALAAASFFGAAKGTSSVAALVAASLVTSAVVAYGTARLALRVSGLARRPRLIAGLVGGAVALVAGLGASTLFVRPTPVVPAMKDRLVPFAKVRLRSGSDVAVARIPPRGRDASAASPLVFLHGGPGAYVRDADLELLRAIADAGVDVVTFDQAGGGASDRLDVRAYSLQRAVADLDALREHLGAERISILGQSWGSMLAYEYARAHPERVARLVLASGGLMTTKTKTFALARTAAAGGKGPSFPAYFYATALLYSVNPDAALAFTSRDQLDVTWRDAAAANFGRWYCREDAASVPSPDEIRAMPPFDAYQALALKGEMEVRDDAPPPPAVVPPTLILRGDCDFVSWEAARLLRDRLGATLVAIPGVGHAIWPKQSALVRELTVAHLTGRPLASAAHQGADDPAAGAAR